MDMMANKKIKQINSQLLENTNQIDGIRKMTDYELNSNKRKRQCLISFVSDDGKIQDYTWAKPIFETNGVPLCSAISSGKVGLTNYCNLQQLLELQNMGWEMLSHGVNHVELTSLNLTDCEVELRDSKQWLNDHGLNCQNIAFPFGLYNFDIQQLTKKYYRSARTIDTRYNDFPLESQELKTVWISPSQSGTDTLGNAINTFAYYKAAIDEAVTNKYYLIISMHCADAAAANYGDLLTQVVQYAKSQAPIVTVNDAMNLIGNIVDVGIYSRQHNYGKCFVISCDGKTTDYINPVFNTNLGVKKNSPIIYSQTIDNTTSASYQQILGSLLKLEILTSTDGQSYIRHDNAGVMENVINFANDNRIEILKKMDLNNNLLIAPVIVLATVANSIAVNNTLFVDSADNKLKFKDSTGTLRIVNLT